MGGDPLTDHALGLGDFFAAHDAGEFLAQIPSLVIAPQDRQVQPFMRRHKIQWRAFLAG